MPKNPNKRVSLNPYSSKKPFRKQDPAIYEGSKFCWRVITKYIDYIDSEWGWGKPSIEDFFSKCLNHLQHYESMTWAETKEEGHCHPVPLEDIALRAKKIIIDRYGDMEDLYQVKAEGLCRLFGRKDKGIFYLIWHDAKHTVYPGGK